MIDEGSIDIALHHARQLQSNSEYQEVPWKFIVQTLNAKIMRLIGNIGEAKSQLDSFVDDINPLMYPIEKLEALVELGYTIFTYNDLEKFDQILSEIRELLKNIPNSLRAKAIQAIATYNHLQGLSAIRKWDLDNGLKYLQKGLAIRKRNNLKRDLAYSNFNIGYVYQIKGEYDVASERYEESLSQFKELGNNSEISFVLANWGLLKILQEDKSGKDMLYEAVDLSKNLYNQIFISEPLFELAHALLMEGKTEEAKKYIGDLEDLYKKTNDKIVGLRFELISALYHKYQTRLADKAKSQQLLRDLMNNSELELGYLVIAIKHYCELLIDELRLSEQKEIIEELKRNIDTLFKLGLKYSITNLILDSLILQTKISIISGSLKDASDLITEAKKIANREQKLKYLEQIDKEHVFLSSVIENYGKAKILTERSEFSYGIKISEYLKEAQSFIAKDRTMNS